MRSFLCVFIFILFGFSNSFAFNDSLEVVNKKRGIDTLTYETQSGLPVAASKIYFSDRKFAFSGFGEINYTHYNGPKSVASEDIELYMTNMYRFVGYLAYKPIKKIVLYAEIFAELMHDRKREIHGEYFLEFFADFLIHDKFNVRVGTHQVQIGYLNNNDEPILFYSVNRPEVERIIIPSTWIDLGIMTYGNITKDIKWTFSVYQGLSSDRFNGASWIRRGRDDAFRFQFNSVVLNSKWTYTGIKNTELAVNGLWTRAGNNEILPQYENERIKAATYLLASYVRHEYKNMTFMFLGSYGNMRETDKIYNLTASATGMGQVIGSDVYGYYAEIGYDVLPIFRNLSKDSNKERKDNFLVKHNEVKLPMFVRYERLNTHAGIHESLIDLPRFQTDLHALTLGLNFNPRRNIVLKANYQFRWNKIPLETGEMEGDRFEIGLGFIF
jgi:hypothetical protein